MKIPWPKEHGGFGMIATPLLLGWLVAGFGPGGAPGGPWRGLLFILSVLALYLTHEPIDRALFGRDAAVRREMLGWTARFTMLALIFLGPVVFSRSVTLTVLGTGLAALAIMALVLWLQRHGRRRDLLTRALAPAGMALAAPLTEWAVRGSISALGWTLAALTYLFFLGSLLRVRSLIGERGQLGFRSVSAVGNLLIMLGPLTCRKLGGAVGGLGAAGGLFASLLGACAAPHEAWLALAPGFWLSLVWLVRPPVGLGPFKIGMIELAANVIFAGVLVWAYLR